MRSFGGKRGQYWIVVNIDQTALQKAASHADGRARLAKEPRSHVRCSRSSMACKVPACGVLFQTLSASLSETFAAPTHLCSKSLLTPVQVGI